MYMYIIIHKCNYPTRAKTSYRLLKPRTEVMRTSTIKDLNAINLHPTAFFNSMKTTLINNTALIYGR